MRIGVALSGGGFRAAAFHLGVLKRLEELRILPHIEMLSTVSGGAITGAAYALGCARSGDGRPGAYPVERLIDAVRPRLTRNLRREALLGTPARSVRTALSFVVPNVRRMPLVADELDRAFFGGAKLSEVPPWVVISATSLRTGKAWKFYHDRAGDYLMGATDRTEEIRLADAVGASAAYPGLTDPFPLHTRWEDVTAEQLDPRRWLLSPDASRWRRRFGRPSGPVTIPMVDGGVYDNEGLNGLRSANLTHVILSNAVGPEDDLQRRGTFQDLFRLVNVMHARLGAVTRQLAHEMTHAVDPGEARVELLAVAAQLRERGEDPALLDIAGRLEHLAGVGWPPRGNQFSATAQVILCLTELAKNRSATYVPPYDVLPEDRGLTEPLATDLSRVRTDLDALLPETVDLLIAQGYFLTDYYLKTAMPEVLATLSSLSDPCAPDARPMWEWAQGVVRRANTNETAVGRALQGEAKRRVLFGHTLRRGEWADGLGRVPYKP